MNTVAIIPARGGSKGVPGKNIKSLAGYPLIAYSIAAAKLSKKIERIIVSTDSDDIAEISKKFGAEIPFKRPSEISQDSSTDLDFVLHALSWLKENEKQIPEYFVHLRPTTPLRDPKIIDKAIKEIESKPDSTSLRSAHKASESPFKWFRRDKDGFFNPLITSLKNDDINAPRQGYPEAYIPNGYVDVLKSAFILKGRVLHGEKIIGFVSPKCIEVDSADDFEFLEYEIRAKASVLLNYLKENFKRS
ncbi:cytidylyltransferase domain-containing protein [Elusimicrobiota bacterium]